METLRNNTEEGREALYEVLRYFPDSVRATEAKRIIGEMNMDALFSPSLNNTRKDYVVQPGRFAGAHRGQKRARPSNACCWQIR